LGLLTRQNPVNVLRGDVDVAPGTAGHLAHIGSLRTRCMRSCSGSQQRNRPARTGADPFDVRNQPSWSAALMLRTTVR
jgi:hypothetical protein